jgi:hypothetical protein
MSGRKAHTRRIALIAAASVIALPLGVALAGSAHAADSGPLGGLPVDTSAITGLLGGGGTLPVVGDLPVVGGLLGGVTGGTSAADPTAALSAVTGAAKGTPAEGVVDAVTGITGGADAKTISSAATPDVVSGLLGGSSNGLPVVGGLLGNTSSLPVVGGLVDSLGLGDVLDGVLGTVGGLLGTVTGIVGGVTGGLLGGGIDDSEPSNGGHGHSHGNGGDSFEETALPHTGGNADATALLICAGLATAGTGVTLVSRRRRALSV